MRIAPIKTNYFSQVPFKSVESKSVSNESLHIIKTVNWNKITFREEKDGVKTSCIITVPKKQGEIGNILFESSKNGKENLEDRVTAISWRYSNLGGHAFEVYGARDKENLDALSETIDKIRNNTEFKANFYNDWSSAGIESQFATIKSDLEFEANCKPKSYMP